MADQFEIGVVITGDDSKFRATGKSSEKAIQDIGNEAGKASAKISDLGKATNNVKGVISDKFNSTGLGGFVGDVTKGTSSLENFLGSATVAAGAIIGIGSAAASAGSAVFGLVKQAADTGSAIKDFQDKTGLAAETIGTLKLQAEQSGIGFDKLSTPVAKFNKLLYDAKNGSDSAIATLKKLNVTNVNDLDGSLSQALATIHNVGDETSKTGLSMEAFGSKSGTIMRAVADNVDGNLNKAIATAKKLGVTLSQEDVNAADDFGDTLHLLGTQAQVTSAKFALQFAPEITKSMQDVSKAFSDNQSTATDWGKKVAEVIRGTRLTIESENAKTIASFAESAASYLKYVNLWALGYDLIQKRGQISMQKDADAWKNVQVSVDKDAMSPLKKKPPPGGDVDELEGKRASEKLAKENAEGLRSISKAIADGDKQTYMSAQENLKTYYKSHTDLTAAFRATFLANESAFVKAQIAQSDYQYDIQIAQEENAYKKQGLIADKKNVAIGIQLESNKRIQDADNLITETQKKNSESRAKFTEKEYQQKLEIYKADDEKQIAQVELDKLLQQNGIISEEAYQTKLGVIKRDSIRDQIRLYNQLLENTDLSPEKREEINNKLKILNLDLGTQEINNSRAVAEAKIRDSEAVQKEQDKEIAKNKELVRSRIAPVGGIRERRVTGVAVNDATPTKAPGFLDGLFGNQDKDLQTFTSTADKMKATYKDLEHTAGAALGSMIEGGAQLLAQWIVTGEVTGKAVAQMTASIIAGVASQAAIKAIFEVAEGIAALARLDPVTAGLHFASAKVYGVVALGATAIGAGIGAAGGLSPDKISNGSASSGSSGSSSPSDSFLSNSPTGQQTDFLRQSQTTNNNPYYAQQAKAVNELNNTIDALNNKLSSMAPGDVLTAGARQKPGFISDTAHSEIKKNPTKSGQWGRTLGLR